MKQNVGAPQVSYRETFRAGTQARGFFKRQSGGKGQFGDVWIEFTPNEEGKGFEFENAIVGGVVPREFTFHTVNKDVKVKLTHTRDNCFTSFNVCFNAECWIFFSQFLKGDTHLVLVCFRFWFNHAIG